MSNRSAYTSLVAGLVAVGGLLLNSVAEAGGPPPGALTYAPAAVVPGLQGIGLLILAALLGFIAFKMLAKQAQVNRVAALAALGVSAVLAGLGGVQVAQDVYAAVTAISLSNPNGGSVPIPQSYTAYSNDSGVLLTITNRVDPNCGQRSNRDINSGNTTATDPSVSLPECLIGTELGVGTSCFTNACGGCGDAASSSSPMC